MELITSSGANHMVGFGLTNHGSATKSTSSKTKTVPSKALAQKFYDELSSRNLLNRAKPPKLSAWANQFRLLLKAYSEEEVQKVLKDYMLIVNMDGVPQAFSAQAFREKYEGIKRAIDRHAKRSPKAVPKELQGIQVSDSAKNLSKELALLWPGVERRHELLLIQHTLNYFISFERRLRIVHKKLKEEMIEKNNVLSKKLNRPAGSTSNSDYFRVADYILAHWSTSKQNTRWYINNLNDYFWRFKPYGGIQPFLLHDGHKMVLRRFYEITEDYQSEAYKTDFILDMIEKTKLEEENG